MLNLNILNSIFTHKNLKPKREFDTLKEFEFIGFVLEKKQWKLIA